MSSFSSFYLNANALTFVQNLATFKKVLEDVSQNLALADRAAALRRLEKYFSAHAEDLARAEAEQDGVTAAIALEKSVAFARAQLGRVAAELEVHSASDMQRASGLTALLCEGIFSVRSVVERLAPAIAAGNVCFVHVPRLSDSMRGHWERALVESGLPLRMISFWTSERDELISVLSSHPSIRAVSFIGTARTGASVRAAAAHAGKKTQIVAGAKNSLLILPGADPKHWPAIAAGLFTAPGANLWGYHRVFTVESELDQVLERLRTAASPVNGDFADLRRQITEDKGKPVELAAGMLAVRDLTNCSPLQLEEVAAPLIIVNTVKYTHEMAKWTNTGEYGLAAGIWGPEEKAHKLALKLDVGACWINSWMSSVEPLWGWKKSSFGDGDFRWNGKFYSDVRSLTP